MSGSRAFVSFINTTANDITINNLKLEIETLSNYFVYNITNENENRLSELMSQLNSNIPSFVSKDMTTLYKEFSDIFALKTDKLTHNNFYKQTLRLRDQQPVYTKSYRIPQSQKSEINNQVSHMLKNDIIEPSTSSYNSPVLLVPKKSTDGVKNGV